MVLPTKTPTSSAGRIMVRMGFRFSDLRVQAFFRRSFLGFSLLLAAGLTARVLSASGFGLAAAKNGPSREAVAAFARVTTEC